MININIVTMDNINIVTMDNMCLVTMDNRNLVNMDNKNNVNMDNKISATMENTNIVTLNTSTLSWTTWSCLKRIRLIRNKKELMMISYHVFQFGNLLNIGLMVTMATIR